MAKAKSKAKPAKKPIAGKVKDEERPAPSEAPTVAVVTNKPLHDDNNTYMSEVYDDIKKVLSKFEGLKSEVPLGIGGGAPVAGFNIDTMMGMFETAGSYISSMNIAAMSVLSHTPELPLSKKRRTS